jgi:hypothetical protein
MKKIFGCNCREELHELKMRIDFLANRLDYQTDDYWFYMGERPAAPLETVVRRIANHLGMQIHRQSATEVTYRTEFKKGNDK